MFELYDEIIKLFEIYDTIIDSNSIIDNNKLDPPLLKRQICVKDDNHNLYNIVKLMYDNLIKKLFILEKYDMCKKDIYNFEKIGFEYSYGLLCRNMDIENPNYNDYNAYYTLVNTLNTIHYTNEETTIYIKNYDHLSSYFIKKNNILINKIKSNHKKLYNLMKHKNMINEDDDRILNNN